MSARAAEAPTTGVLDVAGRELKFEVRRSSRRRRRVALSLDPTGTVRVDAPPRTSLAEIRSILLEHGSWITQRMARLEADGVVRSLATYEPGSWHYHLGRHLKLALREDVPAAHRLDEWLVLPAADTSSEGVRTSLEAWYRSEGARLFPARLEQFATALPWLRGRVPPWRQRFMSSQWGSCSASGRLSLNTHLVKAPLPLIDYVLLHELCHLEHLDHSSRFYALMARHMPQWKARRRALGRWVWVLSS